MSRIPKTYIGNTIASASVDHILTVADNIYDEKLQRYQDDMNSSSVYISSAETITVVTPSFNPESDTVHITPQSLSDEQKTQARNNIDAASIGDINDIKVSLDKYVPIEIIGDVTNAPDGEDLTQETIEGNSKIRFANRPPLNGMGEVYVRRNNGTTTLVGSGITSQFDQQNTIYVLRYDYDLSGETLNVPSGSILRFDGGGFANGTINGNHTIIDADSVEIFKEPITIDGTWDNNNGYAKWFSADTEEYPHEIRIFPSNEINI